MSAPGDKLRTLAAEVDTMETQRSMLDSQLGVKTAEIVDLLARIKELESVPPPSSGKLIHSDNFQNEPKDVKDGGPYLIDAQPGSFKVVNGELAVRIRADGPLDDNGRAGRNARRRCEFGPQEPGQTGRIYRRDPYGKRFRYALSFRFPKGYGDENKVVVCQWHGGPPEPGDRAARNPPVSLEFYDKVRRLRLVLAPFESTERKTLWELNQIDPEKWYSFVFEAKWSQKKSDGYFRAALNGELIVNYFGQTGYDDTPGYVFMRCGIYAPSYTDSKTPAPPGAMHEVFFRQLKIEEIV